MVSWQGKCPTSVDKSAVSHWLCWGSHASVDRVGWGCGDMLMDTQYTCRWRAIPLPKWSIWTENKRGKVVPQRKFKIYVQKGCWFFTPSMHIPRKNLHLRPSGGRGRAWPVAKRYLARASSDQVSWWGRHLGTRPCTWHLRELRQPIANWI